MEKNQPPHPAPYPEMGFTSKLNYPCSGSVFPEAVIWRDVFIIVLALRLPVTRQQRRTRGVFVDVLLFLARCFVQGSVIIRSVVQGRGVSRHVLVYTLVVWDLCGS